METQFGALPTDLVIDVLGRVASASFTDLRSAKRSCKEFLEAAKEDIIHRKVSLEQFPVVQWRENHQITNFLDRCRRNKNLEALFRKGAVDYFGGKDPNNAIECLEEAAKSGHEDASYTLAIILLFREGELKKKGVKHLTAMKKSKIQKTKINSCRQRLKNILKMIWVKNAAILNQPRPIFCTAHHNRRRVGWDSDGEPGEEHASCDECSCDEEIGPIYDALPGILL